MSDLRGEQRAERLRYAMQASGYTLGQVARHLRGHGIVTSRQYISALSKRWGNPTTRLVDGLAAVFGVNAAYFSDESDLPADQVLEVHRRQASPDSTIMVSVMARGLTPERLKEAEHRAQAAVEKYLAELADGATDTGDDHG